MPDKPKTVYVKSFGCSANLADGEVIAGCLQKAGYSLVDRPEDAQFLVYNTCAVKAPTENRIVDLLRKTPQNKKLVVTGCLPVINFERLKKEVSFDAVTGPAPANKIADVLGRVDAGEKVVSLEDNSCSGLCLPRVPINPVVGIVPINYGCLGDCSYCCVHFARGALRSNSITEVVQRVKQDLALGVKEFWLTSQDTACYGKDINTNLAEMVNSVCSVEGDFFVRLGMMNPDHVLGMLDELVDAYGCSKVFKFLHLPVQSGDDTVLGLMNRRYSVADFIRIVSVFRKRFPNLTLSTDVIVGFPGETFEAFENTIQLIETVKPDVVNVSKFFSRPGTPAEKLEPLEPVELNLRSRRLSRLCKQISLEKNKNWLGWEGMVLFDEKGKGKSWMGRNFAYKPVVVKTDKALLGRFAKVQVIGTFSTYLEAKLV